MKRQRRGQRLRAIEAAALADTQEHTAVRAGDLRRFCAEFLAPQRAVLAGIFCALAAWAAAPYFFAMTHRYLIDRVLAPAREGITPPPDRLHGLVMGVWLVFGANMLLHTVNLACNWITSYFTLGVGRRVAMDLRDRLYRKLDALHMAYFDRTQTGRIISRLQTDVGHIQNTVTAHLAHLLVEPVKLTVGFGVLFWMDWRLARILAVAAPVYAAVFLILRPLIRRNSLAQSRLVSRLYGLTTERLGNIQVVQAFGRERGELGAFGRLVHNGVRLGQRQSLYSQGLSCAAGAISTTATVCILWHGLSGVREGRAGMTLGAVVAFAQLATQVFQPIQTLTAMAAVLQTTLVSLRRVFALLDEPHPEARGRIRLTGMAGTIRFERVTFRYPNQAHPALREVSLDVRPGEHVAIMGPSGAGKTTLFNLLLRFYEPQEGRIAVGGVNLGDADIASLRRHVRYVQQEPFLFSGTIQENITYGAPTATDREVVEVARQVEMHEFIMGLPDRYDTQTGEQGMGLSGGQRQRLALATALLTRPEVLLLDDTTSALDAQTEARIRETLARAQAGRTSLVITQRVATARGCDRIVVLEDGRVTQNGTHAELSEAPGFYRRICEQQDMR